MGYALPMARFIFHGYRYILTALDMPAMIKRKSPKLTDAAITELVRQMQVCETDEDLEVVRNFVGTVTFLPAEGLMA